MYSIDIMAWNDSEIEELKVWQRVLRRALNAPWLAVIEALKGGVRLSTLRKGR